MGEDYERRYPLVFGLDDVDVYACIYNQMKK